MSKYKATLNPGTYKDYKGTSIYAEVLEIDANSIRRDIGSCLISIKEKLDTNRALKKEVFSPASLLETVERFLGEYVTITQTEE